MAAVTCLATAGALLLPSVGRAAMPLRLLPGTWISALRSEEPAGLADAVPPPSGIWVRFRLDPLPPSQRSGLDAELRWLTSDEGPLGSAESRAESLLGLDDLDFGSSRLSLQKDLGSRIRVTSFTGYQESSQRQARVEYRLGRSIFLRSEALERGESAVSLRSDLRFW